MSKAIFDLWCEVSPELAFSAGLKDFAASLWIPTIENIKSVRSKIKKLSRGADPVAKKFLLSLDSSLLSDEPQDPPAAVFGVLYTHLLIEGVNEKHMLSLAEQCLQVLCCQEWLKENKWPIELQVLTVLQCSGALSVISEIKKHCKSQETKDALTSVAKRLMVWKHSVSRLKLKRGDFSEIFPLLKKSKGFKRRNHKSYIRDVFDYAESPEQIERLALSWIDRELPLLDGVVKRLAKRYGVRASVESVRSAVDKNQRIPQDKLLSTIKSIRKVLQPVAQESWVDICKGYRVDFIETPSYLVPFIPTAAMNTFNSLGRNPYCVFYVTTDKRGSPSGSLPDIVQTIVHEEYGHCVNFLNSYFGFVGLPSLVERLGSSLEIPITEGISFHRELEALKSFERLVIDRRSSAESKFVSFVEKFCSFDEFVDGVAFVVLQWRMVRFLRAISDVQINKGVPISKFIEWAHKKTGLSKKLIYDQTFFFQEMPGYAPCYSVFGERVRKLQERALSKGVLQRDFNTFICSVGFPARSLLEQKVIKKFKL